MLEYDFNFDLTAPENTFQDEDIYRDIQERYYQSLYSEFCKAKGLKQHISYELSSYSVEFYEWLDDYKKMLKLYKCHLILGDDITERYDEYYECDKGKANSIVREEQRISEFAKTPSTLLSVRNEFFIKNQNGMKLVRPDYKFLTFNPKDDERLIDFTLLHNSGNQIIFSVIGDNTDEDKKEKIYSFRALPMFLDETYDTVEDTYENKYFYTIYSKPKTKVKTKVMGKVR